MIKLVILRHGESTWNEKGLFTGWTDVPLSAGGRAEAKKAAKKLKSKGYSFDVVFANLHKRTLQTLSPVMKELKLTKIPVHKSWRLNERHYGALQGLSKPEMARKFGKKQVFLWRRSYATRPPSLRKSDKRYKLMLATYKGVDKKYFPLAESLKDTYRRTVPYWKEEIIPALKAGKRVLIVASHNSLRSVIKHLDKIPDREIPTFTIPYGIPLVYELNEKLEPVRHYYLGSASEVRKKLDRIAAQGTVKK